MSPIVTALSKGYSLNQILNFMSKSFPGLSKGIATAKAQGHSIEEIVDFITKISQTSPNTPLTSQYEAHNKEQKRQAEATKDVLKKGLSIGGSALGAYAIGRAVPAIAQSLLPQASPNTPGTPSAAPAVPSSNPPISPGQATQAMAPKPNIQLPRGFSSKINNLLEAGNNPEQITEYFRYFNPKEVATLEKESSEKIEDIIARHVQENPLKKKEERKLVAFPGDKVGNIESEKNGIAKINVDGKEHHRKLDELVQSPLPEKDLADLYQDLIQEIEKQSGKQVSRNVYWAGYDPKTNELLYIPHNGRAYVYDNISPEDVNELTNMLTQRKSTGENYIGAWEKNTSSPIGAAMYQLIQRLQQARGGKGNEYKSRFETLYDAIELPKSLAKEKNAKVKKAKKPRFT